MARTKTVTPESLAALGAEALAEVLIAHAATDPALRKKLGMLLAGTEGPGKLAAEIDKRIKTIGRSRSFVDLARAQAPGPGTRPSAGDDRDPARPAGRATGGGVAVGLHRHLGRGDGARRRRHR